MASRTRSRGRIGLPTDSEREAAVGKLEGIEIAEYSAALYPPLVSTGDTERDWMYTSQEPQQGYESFKTCPTRNKLTRRQSKIYILPLGDEFERDDSVTTPPLDTIVDFVARYYPHQEVELMDSLPITYQKKNVGCGVEKGTVRVGTSGIPYRKKNLNGHVQINAEKALEAFESLVPGDAYCLMVITMVDLFSDPSDLFIAGLASIVNRVGFFSFCRYDSAIYFSGKDWFDVGYSEPQEGDLAELVAKSVKTLVHEIAHMMGLLHCWFYGCLMQGSNHYEEDFIIPVHMCPVCLRKLSAFYNGKLDIVARYEALAEFYEDWGFVEDFKFVRSRLKEIEDFKISKDL